MPINTIQLSIGAHRFKVAVTEADKPRMIAAARRVEETLARVRSDNKVADGERAALMVALQVTAATDTIDQAVLNALDAALDAALECANA